MKKFCGALFALAMAVGLTACADAPTPEKIIRANRDIFSEGKYSVTVDADFQINTKYGDREYTNAAINSLSDIEAKNGIYHIDNSTELSLGADFAQTVKGEIFVDAQNGKVYAKDKNDKWRCYEADDRDDELKLTVDLSKFTLDLFEEMNISADGDNYTVNATIPVKKAIDTLFDTDISADDDAADKVLENAKFNAELTFDKKSLKIKSIRLTLPDSMIGLASAMGVNINTFTVLINVELYECEDIVLPQIENTDNKDGNGGDDELLYTEVYDDNQMYDINMFQYDIDGELFALPMTASLIFDYDIADFEDDFYLSGGEKKTVLSEDGSMALTVYNHKSAEREAEDCKVIGATLYLEKANHRLSFFGVSEKSGYQDFTRIFGSPAYLRQSDTEIHAEWRFTGGRFTAEFSKDGALTLFDVIYTAV